jgi:PIN domain nuclease of toxin-antitoxin system
MARGQIALSRSEHMVGPALGGFEILPVTEPIARQAALWEWEHRDPADRLIAATARLHGIELWHTDTSLQKLTGFPQRYFRAVEL